MAGLLALGLGRRALPVVRGFLAVLREVAFLVRPFFAVFFRVAPLARGFLAVFREVAFLVRRRLVAFVVRDPVD